ncbi:MAG: carboxypeptidase-like regulatory domain-containing protein [Candidatus Cryptobacteroides sp.]
MSKTGLYRACSILLSLIAGISIFSLTSFGQRRAVGTVRGNIVSAEDGKPLDFVSVVLKPSDLYAVSDNNGDFAIENVPAGKVSASVQFFGMETVDTTFILKTGGAGLS